MAFPQDLPYTRHSPGRGQLHPQGTGPLQCGQNQDYSQTQSPAAHQKLEAHFAKDRLPGLVQCGWDQTSGWVQHESDHLPGLCWSGRDHSLGWAWTGVGHAQGWAWPAGDWLSGWSQPGFDHSLGWTWLVGGHSAGLVPLAASLGVGQLSGCSCSVSAAQGSSPAW